MTTSRRAGESAGGALPETATTAPMSVLLVDDLAVDDGLGAITN
jgi:hypothetical protein